MRTDRDVILWYRNKRRWWAAEPSELRDVYEPRERDAPWPTEEQIRRYVDVMSRRTWLSYSETWSHDDHNDWRWRLG